MPGCEIPENSENILRLNQILFSLQIRLRPLPVQTQGTQLLKLFIQIYYNNSHQHHENVTKMTVDNAKDIYGYM